MPDQSAAVAHCRDLVAGVNHVSFTVRDLDAPIGFFRDGLGFALTSRAGRPAELAAALTGVAGADVEIAFLAGAGLVLELILFHAPALVAELPPPANAAAAAHIALNVTALDPILALADRHGFARPGQVVTITGGPNHGRRLVYLQHPAGVNLELIEG